MKRRIAFTLLTAMLIVPILTSCGEMMKGKGLAEAAVPGFRAQYNDKKFKEIYDASDASLKSATAEADFLAQFEKWWSALGRFKESSLSGFNINSHNGRTTVNLTYSSTFESATADEIFVYHIDGGACRLQRYEINNVKSKEAATPSKPSIGSALEALGGKAEQ